MICNFRKIFAAMVDPVNGFSLEPVVKNKRVTKPVSHSLPVMFEVIVAYRFFFIY